MSYQLINGEAIRDNERMFHAKALFHKVFSSPEGMEIIKILRRIIKCHPKTDLEYARYFGMQMVVNTIIDMAEIFGEFDNDRRTE